MAIQENVLYSELSNLPSIQERELSNLERDFFGQISVPQLMSNYSKLNDNNPSHGSAHFQPPVVTLCLEDNFPTSSDLKRPLNSDLSTYSTLERTSLGSHYEVRDPLHQDEEEKYTELNQLTRIQQIHGNYESLISTEDRNNACRILKVSPHYPPTSYSHPEVIYRALHR
ncbi:hypothetical protein LOD99_576 [Oopsacas minuta]|uniref:Uncharacterized protein n=1 Tax=Oopsacas minuta TaxID=111878 RepID=A0AAV7KB37_9METZ|nr:hypothetical protein LOD99_576 [Oopsacas minuta]